MYSVDLTNESGLSDIVEIDHTFQMLPINETHFYYINQMNDI